PVRYELKDGTLTVTVPAEPNEKVNAAKYEVQPWPNARLAGLLTKDEDEDVRRLVPLLFAEVPLSDMPEGRPPRLRTTLPARDWVWTWDARRRCGYLLIAPYARTTKQLRFEVE